MNKTIIEKNIAIKAPAAKVWNVLQQDEHTRAWYAAFSEGSHARTDWKEGSKAIFTDNSNCGMVARITRSEPGKLLVLTYEGSFSNGAEDYTSEEAQQVKGGREIYRLQETDGVTTLSIEQDMAEAYIEFMNGAWDKALHKIKELAEQ